MKLAIMFPPYPPGKIPVTERVLLPAAFMSPFSRLHFTEMQFKKSSQFLASQIQRYTVEMGPLVKMSPVKTAVWVGGAEPRCTQIAPLPPTSLWIPGSF